MLNQIHTDIETIDEAYNDAYEAMANLAKVYVDYGFLDQGSLVIKNMKNLSKIDLSLQGKSDE